jgi:hypothetical protein
MKKGTPVLIEIAKQMREAGWQYQGIALVMGVRGTTIRCWIDPEYRKKTNELHRKRWRRLQVQTDVVVRKYEAADADQLAKQIPPDTRDLTARLCGDPVPGRRAIDHISVESLWIQPTRSNSYGFQGAK